MTPRIALYIVLVTAGFGMTTKVISADAPAKVIKITAKRFEYTPREITLKKGESVVIELTTEDRSHGFSIPAMNVRTDVLPGRVAQVKLTPQTAGKFDFFCDIFCGSQHEDMNGRITVTE